METWLKEFNLNYVPKTTFWDAFTSAENINIEAIKEIFKKVFEGCKTNIEYVTELYMVMNFKCLEFSLTNNDYSSLYANYYFFVKEYVCNNFKNNDLDYFNQMTTF